jgi:hypothetical protein
VPATRLERLVVLSGLLGAAVLGFFAVLAWQDYRESQPSTQRGSAPSTPAETGETAGVVAGTTVERAPRTASSQPVSLELVAARGDSWLEVYVGSANGDTLFLDTLAEGDRERFREKRLWLRFGAAQNVDATLNGEPVELPDGIAEVVVTADGIQSPG